jgi:4-carboxymuconolactone decarboxylase
VAIAWVAAGPTVEGQSPERLPALPKELLTPAQAKAIEDFIAVRGPSVTGPFGPFVPLLRSPELMVRAAALGEYLRFRSALPPKLSEMAILLVARRWTQQYEWYAHEPPARAAGLSAETISGIAEGRRPTAMSEHESVLYDLYDELNRVQSVSDPTYARAKAAFGEPGVMDALGLFGYYTMLAMVMNTAGTPLPEGVPAPLRPLP